MSMLDALYCVYKFNWLYSYRAMFSSVNALCVAGTNAMALPLPP